MKAMISEDQPKSKLKLLVSLRNGLKSTRIQQNVCKVLYQGRKNKRAATKQVYLVKQHHSRKGSTATTD